MSDTVYFLSVYKLSCLLIVCLFLVLSINCRVYWLSCLWSAVYRMSVFRVSVHRMSVYTKTVCPRTDRVTSCALVGAKKINLGLSHKVMSIVKQVSPRKRGLELISLCDMRYRETGFHALARHLAEKRLTKRLDPTAFTFTVQWRGPWSGPWPARWDAGGTEHS